MGREEKKLNYFMSEKYNKILFKIAVLKKSSLCNIYRYATTQNIMFGELYDILHILHLFGYTKFTQKQLKFNIEDKKNKFYLTPKGKKYFLAYKLYKNK